MRSNRQGAAKEKTDQSLGAAAATAGTGSTRVSSAARPAGTVSAATIPRAGDRTGDEDPVEAVYLP
jgi:hypothetical protein